MRAAEGPHHYAMECGEQSKGRPWYTYTHVACAKLEDESENAYRRD